MKTRLKELRQARHMTQLRLSYLSRLSQSAISKIELGTQVPDGEAIIFFADFFGVSTDYFLGRSNYRYTPEFILPLNENARAYNVVFDDYVRLSPDDQKRIQEMISYYLHNDHDE